MNEVLLGSLIDKVDAFDKKIEELNKKIDQIPAAYEEVLNPVKTGFKGLRSDVQNIFFPEKEMSQLSGRLATTIELFKKPVEQKIIHRHEILKILWITAALFLSLCLVSTTWFSTYNKLELYKAGDTKYRYLKLVSNVSLGKQLILIDSLYRADPKMREFVIAKEEQNQRDFETMQKSLQMEKEAKERRKKVRRKGEKSAADN
ncbi:MAG: hypothetical protein JWQ09_1921 [Segetibacter sp.]|nr:hypothetical protein [Segetibacter sp.]